MVERCEVAVSTVERCEQLGHDVPLVMCSKIKVFQTVSKIIPKRVF